MPTFAEQGIASIRGAETYGVFAPPGTPQPTVNALHEALVAASKDPGLVTTFEQVGLEVFTLAPQLFAALLRLAGC